MKIKIIDILNKIANGEEPPKKIKYNDIVYEYEDEVDYKNGTGLDKTFLMDAICTCQEDLNKEVEILETTIKPDLGTIICYKKGETDNAGYVGVVDKVNEDGSVCLKQDDKIKKLGFENTTTPTSASENEAFLMACINFMSMKIDELIDRWNNEK